MAVIVGFLVPLVAFFVPRPVNPHLLEAGAYLCPLATILLLSFDEYYRREPGLKSRGKPREFFTLAYFVAVGVWLFILYKLYQATT